MLTVKVQSSPQKAAIKYIVEVQIISAETTYTNIPDLLDTAIIVLVLLYFFIYKTLY